MASRLKALSDEKLVEKFSSIAQCLGEIVVNWLPGGAKETRRLFALEDEIRGRGREARLKLAPLLHSDSRFVRILRCPGTYRPPSERVPSDHRRKHQRI
jgi:hypothetical protein